MVTISSPPRRRQLQVWRPRQGSHVLRPPADGCPYPARADVPRVMGPPNRAPGTPIMGAPDSAGGISVMGGPDAGGHPYVMGGPDAGPRADVMGRSDLRFVDSLFTGRTTP